MNIFQQSNLIISYTKHICVYLRRSLISAITTLLNIVLLRKIWFENKNKYEVIPILRSVCKHYYLYTPLLLTQNKKSKGRIYHKFIQIAKVFIYLYLFLLHCFSFLPVDPVSDLYRLPL